MISGLFLTTSSVRNFDAMMTNDIRTVKLNVNTSAIISSQVRMLTRLPSVLAARWLVDLYMSEQSLHNDVAFRFMRARLKTPPARKDAQGRGRRARPCRANYI